MPISSGFILRDNYTHLAICTASSFMLAFFHTSADEDFVPDNQNIVLPRSTTGSRVCTSFEVIDDLILENPEQFNVRVILPGFIGLLPGVNKEACVFIEDDEDGKAVL